MPHFVHFLYHALIHRRLWLLPSGKPYSWRNILVIREHTHLAGLRPTRALLQRVTHVTGPFRQGNGQPLSWEGDGLSTNPRALVYDWWRGWPTSRSTLHPLGQVTAWNEENTQQLYVYAQILIYVQYTVGTNAKIKSALKRQCQESFERMYLMYLSLPAWLWDFSSCWNIFNEFSPGLQCWHNIDSFLSILLVGDGPPNHTTFRLV